MNATGRRPLAPADRARNDADASRIGRRPRLPKPRRAAVPPKAPAEGSAAATLRVSTYNIHKGVLREFIGLRRVTRIHELRARLHELDSDLIFLQEVQGQHERHARRLEHWPEEPQDVFLAKSPKLRQTFETAYGRNASYLHGHHGNALLSRYPIVGLENRDISDHALEKRGVLHCVVKVGRLDVHCFVVHFGLLARSRERQLGALIDWVSNAVSPDAPLIIAGDFNDWRNQLSDRLCGEIGVVEVFDALRPQVELVRRATYFARDRLPAVELPESAAVGGAPRMVRTARTFPALVPWFRMDRIYQRGFRVNAARVLRGIEWARLSDHSPLVADLELIDPGA
ncbi:MAG: endonuclease/exonuclease/phosphatase family protein [Burkholderiaceae bacterium]|nr:endonuclease/exonuclease/phosphatase family protein [Burkholderiaceae bacterium]MBX3614444.1 endonuclease/exonuclease/phosphatase family protein [Burkholderiaceae bacterium]HMN63781.1 endonuclease/exonuclease/phosphatase family protein [Burkholderiaceae bacterium]